MASPNVISFAVDHGYYDPKSGELFSWKKAYSPTEHNASSSKGTRARTWRFFDVMAPSRKFSPDTPNMEFPFSIKPDKKLSVQDVMNLTRDKYQGTVYDPGAGLWGGPFKNPNYHPRPVEVDGKKYNTPRTISVNRAEYTTVTQCRDWLPNPIGGIVWLAFGAQDTSCYMPLYIGITEIPHSFQIGDHWEFNRKSARWAFDYADFHTLVVYYRAIQDVKKAQEKWEARAVKKTPTIDNVALELYQKDPKQAVQFLTDYCINNAGNVINAWWKLGDELLVKYRGLWLYDKETRKRELMTYPEDWLKEIIRYHNLTPEPPEKEKK
jgi:dipeptidase